MGPEELLGHRGATRRRSPAAAPRGSPACPCGSDGSRRSTTGPVRSRRCSAPCDRDAREVARERKHQRGLQDAPDGPGRPARGSIGARRARRPARVGCRRARLRPARAGRRRSSPVANADSSNDVCIRCSSATISSTRSSELSPSSSMLVEASTRPAVREAREDGLDGVLGRRGHACPRSRPGPSARSPPASACACPPSAAGASPGHADAVLTRW